MDAFHGGNIMKTGEARGIYSSVLKSYNEQKFKLSKQREELKERMESTPDGKTRYADEAATLELKYNAVAEKQDEYQNYVNQLMAQWEGKFNSVVAKQQGEAAKDYGEEMGKIMTVARRLMHGDQVPMQDEKKLMEYDKDLYIMAKNAGMMAQLEKRKSMIRSGKMRKRKSMRIRWKQPMQRKHLQPDRKWCRWNLSWRQRLGKRSQSHRMV